MLSTKNNIFLVGLMAVGKSTVGKYLAEELGLEFLDTDREIEHRAGVDIAWIFELEGEDGFRDREVLMVDELTARSGIVLATGGGVVLREENRKHLAARGSVVYLKSSVDQLVERTEKDKRRPLLQQTNVREVLERLERERAPLYREIADFQFDSGGGSPRTLARQIAETLRNEGRQYAR